MTVIWPVLLLWFTYLVVQIGMFLSFGPLVALALLAKRVVWP